MLVIKRSYLLGVRKSEGVPNTRVMKASTQFTKDRERKNLRKPVLTSKVVNPFTCALAPPFIGRRREFYIPRLPSNLGNIPSVNMDKNVFYIPWFAGLISNIYKPATSSHFKPGLLRWRLWLGFFLTPESLIHENHRSLWFPNQDFTRFPNFADSRFQDFAGFWFQDFAGFWFQDFADSNHSEIDNRFANRSQLRLLFSHIIRRLAWCRCSSEFPHECRLPAKQNTLLRRRHMNLSTNLADPTFRGCKVFAQFPNTSPSGKRVDSDGPIPRIDLEFWWKTSPSERRSGHASSW
jgi:hypothetical protein